MTKNFKITSFTLLSAAVLLSGCINSTGTERLIREYQERLNSSEQEAEKIKLPDLKSAGVELDKTSEKELRSKFRIIKEKKYDKDIKELHAYLTDAPVSLKNVKFLTDYDNHKLLGVSFVYQKGYSNRLFERFKSELEKKYDYPVTDTPNAYIYLKENLMIQLSSDKSAVTLSFFSKKFIGENLRKSFFPKDSETKKNSEPPEPSKKKKSKFKKFFKSIFH